MAKKTKTTKAFTIIELLVVIAIIGLLASIVMVSTKDSRYKAELAKRKTFSASIYHALGSNIIGNWNFNDGTVNDSSGNGNNGVNYGITFFDDEITGKAGKNGTFQVFDSDKLTCKSGSLTYELWVKYPSFLGSTQNTFISKTRKIAPGTYVGVYMFYVTPSSGKIEPFFGSSCSFFGFYTDIDYSKWNHFAVAYDKKGEMDLYINGILKNHKTDCLPIPIADDFGYLSIDTHGSSGFGENAMIDDVRIYDSSLTIAEIQKNFSEGLLAHN